ncbi:unnamed protein product [Lactuca virosa]|uniref:Uncharacterized protein n=1 Tax=Lactuca virosa TaxID=75947 RepID=A0AAU9PBY5_9ASTR|nr:unnamed protein product [Lactuca virosa]
MIFVPLKTKDSTLFHLQSSTINSFVQLCKIQMVTPTEEDDKKKVTLCRFGSSSSVDLLVFKNRKIRCCIGDKLLIYPFHIWRFEGDFHYASQLVDEMLEPGCFI